MVQSSLGDRQEVSSRRRLQTEHETVGMEMLRCTAGAGEITTPARIRQAEVVAHGPTD